MPSPLLESKHTAIATALLAMLGAVGCGKKAREPGGKGITTGVAHAAGRPADARAPAGVWRWSHLSDVDGVRRVELERWHLQRSGNELRGHYDREVTFLSLDGVPFRCSQSLRYRLTTRYSLRGRAGDGGLELHETGFKASSSPCDSGQRNLSQYRGAVIGEELKLTWKGGSQSLRRETHPTPVRGAVEPIARSANGNWRWQNRREIQGRAEVRVESERWNLKETNRGTITGSYQRAVTVFSQNGRTFSCSGKTFYEYRDHYRVRGSRQGNQIILSEVDSTPAESPCITHTKRHLDAATGRIDGEFLVLEWRGRHQQILHR